MAMRTHELHPALVHYPLALLPAAAIVEAVAAGRRRPGALDRTGRALWWAMAGGGLLTGLAGMAASQEIETRSAHTRDRMFVHGMGNFTLVLASFGIAAWRTRHRSSMAIAGLGMGASVAALYTAYLGGELVYAQGAGVKALGGFAAEQPALFSGRGAKSLAVDAVRGLGWLFRRAGRAITRAERLEPSALGGGAEEARAVH